MCLCSIAWYLNLDLGPLYLKIFIIISTRFIVVCLRSITIGTSRQSQLACHIRVDLRNTGKARIASPGQRSRGRGALIADAHVMKRKKHVRG